MDKRPNQRAEVTNWLRNFLKGRSMLKALVMEAGYAAGYSDNQIMDAFHDLAGKVQSMYPPAPGTTIGHGFTYWSLPEDE